ncbi:(2Fe-2S)-binding protein [Intrasporangium oryzae NRRL B-24470]|uniref:(2Fe-2S)-binding protein n=1 Tax=Intrasporangium oryzae NRRL B-24470 TaxID=1386089 RepID=W9GAF9_9MICO|nr:DUF2231 domain-containing protein [Intrasporangium oryzae]EWT03166.1 (2Fe-2S)-binding protein [Intrasporangium oryzae NRRL B-24470]
MTSIPTYAEQKPRLPLAAQAATALEAEDRLDIVADRVSQLTGRLARSAAGPALRGEWLGHALHPLLTDLPIGMWTAMSVLDFLGGKEARPAAQRLLGVGLLAVAPTALSGWAEWHEADRPAQRVGLAHAALNIAGIAFYARSWSARRRGHHLRGVGLSVAGACMTGAAGYLGGHLAAVRKVSTVHPGFERHDEPAVRNPTMNGSAMHDGSGARTGLLEVVTGQHARITALARRVSSTAGVERAHALQELLSYLAGHEAVEEELIHPLIPTVGQREVGVQRAREEEGAAQQIERLEELDSDSPTFGMQFGLLEEAISHHAKAEETEELPRVISRLSRDDEAMIVRAFTAQEAGVPERHGTFAEMLRSAKADVRALSA